MKSGWNMLSCNLMPFMHSTVLHTWFHKNSRQCALSLVCCSKSYQQSAPQDIIIHWRNDATVNVISTLHNYILYTLFFYQCLSDQFSKHMTDYENLQSVFILHLLLICINCISKNNLIILHRINDINEKQAAFLMRHPSNAQCQETRMNLSILEFTTRTQNKHDSHSTWETSEQFGHSSTSNFSHH
jgi:hypothetical protein